MFSSISEEFSKTTPTYFHVDHKIWASWVRQTVLWINVNINHDRFESFQHISEQLGHQTAAFHHHRHVWFN
jgi:hypothetical protein